jgi:CubicO group peptidase (beta-lactamase class C family)
MKRSVAIIVVLLAAASCSQPGPSPEIQQKITHLENHLLAFKSPAGMLEPDAEQLADPLTLAARMELYKTPGVGIAVVNGNQLEWAQSYGIMDQNTGQPVTSETIFEAASTSKFVTAVLALHLVQNGTIDLDQDVNETLKSWQVPENEFTQKEKVTLRRLLTHLAGMPSTNFDHDASGNYPTLLDVLNGAPPALNQPAVPELEPGAQWQYSNVGYDVIQLLLEDVTGKSFDAIAKEILFDPLGMANSTFTYPLTADRQAREAMPHDGLGVSLKPAMHNTALAHGGLTTTPTDLAKLTAEIMRSYQGESDRILSQATAKMLFHNELDLDPRMFGMPLSEGLGVLLMNLEGGFAFAHPGSNLPGLNCWLIGWPERGTAVVVMTNGAQGELLAMEIIAAMNQLYNK